MREFLDFSRTGYSRMQCARGYFELASRGEDMALSQLRGEHPWEHNLSDAKGHWVYHMLRHRVGDDVFFSTLRALIETFAHQTMRLDDLRSVFEASAPDDDLRTFFAQWLDRPGAPRLNLEWSMASDGGIDLLIRQEQDGDPYQLMLEVAVHTPDGRNLHTIAVRNRETSLTLTADGDVLDVLADPEHRVLMWRPEYTVGGA